MEVWVQNTKNDKQGEGRVSTIRRHEEEGGVALVLIGASLLFGFHLGIIFIWFMIVFAAGSILYSTSNVMLYYRTDQYVAASLNRQYQLIYYTADGTVEMVVEA